MVKPKQLLPILHRKTHYKAALEYRLGNNIPPSSLKDNTHEIEKLIHECHTKIQRGDHHSKNYSRTPVPMR